MVEDLAKRFEVSAQTIRKDLNDLCEHRSLTRIHGGAIIASGVENLAYEARRFVAAEEKKAIGFGAGGQISQRRPPFFKNRPPPPKGGNAPTPPPDPLVLPNNPHSAAVLF